MIDPVEQSESAATFTVPTDTGFIGIAAVFGKKIGEVEYNGFRCYTRSS